MNLLVWEKMLVDWDNFYYLIQVKNSLGKYVVSLLELVYLEW